MKRTTADILSLAMIAAALAVAAYLYPTLPEQIPTHWNAAGEVDGYTAKPWGVLILPGCAVLTWVLMKLVPIISPKGFRTDTFADVINVLQVALIGFFSTITMLVLLEANGVNTYINNFIVLAIGVLFLVLGNFMGKMRKNFFIGIRTPWTLASDEVWARTHRLGGWTFMLGGIAIIVGALGGMTPGWMAAIIATVALIPVGYSFVAYQRIEGFDDNNGDETSA